MIRRCLIALLLFAWLTDCRAQTEPLVISKHYTTAEGLPSNNVQCCLKGRDGFLWFGTWYGLCRFDGKEFLTFNKALKAGSDIPPRKVESIVEDARGNLWLKTVDWKIYTFNPRTECFHAVYDELKPHTKNLQVIKIQRTDEGNVLLLTKDKTLLMAHAGERKEGTVSISQLFESQGKIDPQTSQLYDDVTYEGRDYVVYVGRDFRIFAKSRKTSGTLAEAMAREEAKAQQLTEMLTQKAFDAGIMKYSQLYQDSDSLLWVTTSNNGIYCISTPRRQFQLIPLPDNDLTGVRCIYQTRQGHIIVGARSRNVYIYDTQGQLLQTLPYNKYGIGAVYHAMEDNKGRLWLSTKGDGLVVIPADVSLLSPSTVLASIRHYRHQPDDANSLSGNNVYFSFVDSQQHIWVATLDGGLNLVKEDYDGQLTFCHKGNGFSHYPAYGLYTEVRNITEDQNGHLWVGTMDGLMSIDSRFKSPQEIIFKTYHETHGGTFANNDIYTIYRDKTGQIWVGAFGGGLQQLVNPKDMEFSPLGPREGLRNDVVYSITEDLRGHMWFATEAGLSLYNQETRRIRNFDRYDGLPQVEMEETAAFCCNDGNLWMGCKQGLLIFSPEQVQANKAHYRTFILELVANNQPYIGNTAIPYNSEIELDHDQNAFTIEFAALNYENPGSTSYRYRLEGFDRYWRYSGQHRVGSYNEVPPGNYTFVVESIDDASPAQVSSARLSIHILPPWWATWWAYLIYICIAALIAWLVIRTVLQMNRMRNEIYISQRLAKLISKPDEGDEFIDRLHRIIRKNIPNTEFNVDAIAAEMGLSRSAFYKKVKGQTGFAPVDLIKEFRLSHAVELLQTTNLSIAEVAFRSGFADSSYFGKCFRKRYGQSPREFVTSQNAPDPS